MQQLLFLAQNNGGGGIIGAIFGLIVVVIYIAIIVAIIAGGWKMFVKAGQPGWGILIPIYNIYLLTQIVGRPWWWLLLMLIPIVGIVVGIIIAIDLAKSFGKSALFGIGIIFLGFIFIPILGFGSAQYQGPAAAGA